MIVDLEQKSGISAYCRTKSARSKYISDWKPQEGWITDSTRTFGGWRKHGIKATKDWKFVWGSVKCNKVKIKLKKKKNFRSLPLGPAAGKTGLLFILQMKRRLNSEIHIGSFNKITSPKCQFTFLIQCMANSTTVNSWKTN